MRPRLLIALLVFTALGAQLRAQPQAGLPDELSVQDAIDRVRNENLQLRQQQIQQAISRAGLEQSKWNYVPDLSANWNWQRNFGTSFDAVTFRRVDQTTDFSNPSLRLSTTLFQGFAKYYTLKEAKASFQAENAATRRVENDLMTQVLSAFLQLLVDRSTLAITRERLELLKQQLKQSRSQWKAGVVTEVDVRNLEAQIALEDVNRVSQENQVRRDELALKLLLQLPPEHSVDFIAPDLPQQASFYRDSLPPVLEIEDYAMDNLPQIREPQLRSQASEYSIQQAKAQFYPSLNFSASLSSNFSSNGGIPVQSGAGNFELVRTEFFQQLDDNFSQGFGLTLSVPILSRGQRRQAVEVATLQQTAAEISLKQARNSLQNDIRQAYFDAVAAQRRYRALRVQLKAFRRAFELNEKQYQAGQISFVDYRESLNNITRARQELRQAKFNFLFRRNILAFYGGQPLQLD